MSEGERDRDACFRDRRKSLKQHYHSQLCMCVFFVCMCAVRGCIFGVWRTLTVRVGVCSIWWTYSRGGEEVSCEGSSAFTLCLIFKIGKALLIMFFFYFCCKDARCKPIKQTNAIEKEMHTRENKMGKENTHTNTLLCSKRHHHIFFVVW